MGPAGRVEAVMDDAQHAEKQLDDEDRPAKEGAGEEEGVHLTGKDAEGGREALGGTSPGAVATLEPQAMYTFAG